MEIISKDAISEIQEDNFVFYQDPGTGVDIYVEWPDLDHLDQRRVRLIKKRIEAELEKYREIVTQRRLPVIQARSV